MREESAGETFNFLGFTHYWGRTRTGGWSPKLKTEGKSLRRIFLGKVGMQECGLARGKTHSTLGSQLDSELESVPGSPPSAIWIRPGI